MDINCRKSKVSPIPVGIFILILTQFGLQSYAQSEPCYSDVKPDESEPGYRYQWRESAKLCEGLYIAQVGGNLQIVSLLIGELLFDPEHSSIKVSTPKFLSLEQSVRIQAVAIPLETYYRMDALIPAGNSLLWPLNTVVKPVGLVAEQIGIYGWIERDAEKIFIPIEASPLEDPRRISDEPLIVKVRADVDIETLVWRVSEKNAEQTQWQVFDKVPVRAGKPVSLQLPISTSLSSRVEVAAKQRNSDKWMRLELPVLWPEG